MTTHRLTRRTAFRVAATFAGLFAVTMSSIFAILYLVISTDLTNTLKDQIDDLRETFVEVGATGGRSGLAATVARHANATQPDDNIVLLTDLDGNYLAGNILAIPRFHSWKTIAWSKLPFLRRSTQNTSSDAVLGSWTKLKNGYLFVAGGNGDIKDVQAILLDGLGWAVGLTAFSAVLGGLILGLSAQRRVDAMESVLDSFAHGNLSDRIRRSASRDDLDHVAELINSTLDRLQTLIGSVKQVTTDIAHDLRTPISRIRQKLELAQQSQSSDPTHYQAAIDTALDDIDQVVETFEALLRIAEVSSGARKARFVDVDLKTVLDHVIEALEPVAEDHEHRLVSKIDRSIRAHIKADRQLLNQLFVNLLENSIRHCPSGSRITISLNRSNDDITVHVSDNGPGIPEAERANVLRPLYRLEKSRTTPGSGLGLSLASAITDLHEGTLSLHDNAPGLDVCVRFHANATEASI
ncbi:MAG: sensor histidine kinase [Hyphomicrobium sp.]